MPQMPPEVAIYNSEKQDHGLEKALDHRLIELAQPALQRGERVTIEMPIRNVNRTVGTMLSSEVARKYGNSGLADDTIHVRFAGSAGQSFGAFLAKGITLDLIGEANDYVGKGLSGGHISVQPSPKFRGKPRDNIIVGNTVMYGAIAGEAYFRGVAGERFCVRNSGAHAVVEGVGDHGCEYMTGGTVIVLGMTGRNFAAGMSGGIAYVLDEDGSFGSRCNTSMVQTEPVLAEAEQEARVSRDLWHMGQSDEALLKGFLERHARYCNSARAREILDDWAACRAKFVKVFPTEYRRALGEMAAKRRKLAA
jgi:glutamate synthase (NADPH/NADH) large chain